MLEVGQRVSRALRYESGIGAIIPEQKLREDQGGFMLQEVRIKELVLRIPKMI